MELILQFRQIKCINWFQLFILESLPNPETHCKEQFFRYFIEHLHYFRYFILIFLPFFHVRNFTGFAIISIEMFLFCLDVRLGKSAIDAVAGKHKTLSFSCIWIASLAAVSGLMCLFVLALECHRMLQMNLIWFRYKRDFFFFLFHRVQNHRHFVPFVEVETRNMFARVSRIHLPH